MPNPCREGGEADCRHEGVKTHTFASSQCGRKPETIMQPPGRRDAGARTLVEQCEIIARGEGGHRKTYRQQGAAGKRAIRPAAHAVATPRGHGGRRPVALWGRKVKQSRDQSLGQARTALTLVRGQEGCARGGVRAVGSVC